ncbi:MAG: hypothetical protein R3E84_08855 [Pseudomonadales bacterium]
MTWLLAHRYAVPASGGTSPVPPGGIAGTARDDLIAVIEAEDLADAARLTAAGEALAKLELLVWLEPDDPAPAAYKAIRKRVHAAQRSVARSRAGLVLESTLGGQIPASWRPERTFGAIASLISFITPYVAALENLETSRLTSRMAAAKQALEWSLRRPMRDVVHSKRRVRELLRRLVRVRLLGELCAGDEWDHRPGGLLQALERLDEAYRLSRKATRHLSASNRRRVRRAVKRQRRRIIALTGALQSATADGAGLDAPDA